MSKPSLNKRQSRLGFKKERVNLRLIDGSIIVNVQLLSTLQKTQKLRYRTPFGNAEIALEKLDKIEPMPFPQYHSN